MQDFFAQHVARFIAVAPCFASVPTTPYPQVAIDYLKTKRAGKFFGYADSDSKPPSKPTDCSESNDEKCIYEPGYPMASLHYYTQVS